MTFRSIFQNPGRGLRNGWRMLLFVAGLALVLALLALLDKAVGPSRWILSERTPLVVLLGMSLLALRLEKRPLRDLGLALGRRFGLDFLIGAGLGTLLIVGAALLARVAGGFHWELAAGPVGSRMAWALLGMMEVALLEELLCRGYLFQRLVEGVGLALALLLGAAAFALVHWGNPGMAGATKVWATVNLGLAAVLLGLAWHRTRSLALPIGLHFAWNWVQGSVLGFQVSGTASSGWLQVVFHGRPEWLTGGAFGLEASLPGTLVLLVPIVFLALRKPRT